MESGKFGTMEGKGVKSGADASGTSKRRRFKHKHRRTSRNQSGGGSPSLLVKRDRIKRKHKSRKQSDGQLGMIKRSMIEEHVYGEQQKTNVSIGSSEIPQVKHNEVEKEDTKWVTYARNAGGGEPVFYKKTVVSNPSDVAELKRRRLKRAEIALKLYEKNQAAEFEILEVLDTCGTKLRHPEPDFRSNKYWIHTSFTAISKNDVSPKHFFGELFKDYQTGQFVATFCSTFEPSDDPGFDHGCVFCPLEKKFHPADGYVVGRPPWYVPQITFD